MAYQNPHYQDGLNNIAKSTLHKTTNQRKNLSAEESRSLNKKIAELEKENNCFKKAAAFFAK